MFTVYAGLKNGNKFISLTKFEGSAAHEFEDDVQGPKRKSWWVLDGDGVRQPTQDELDIEREDRDKIQRQEQRDKIIESAVIEYQGNYIDMSPSSVGFMSHSYGSFERGKGVNWKVQDKNTSDKKRINLKKQDIDKITDALFDAIQIIHETADIESPVSPWPLLVE